MAQPVTTVNTPSRGVRRTSRQVSNLGPADSLTSLILIDDAGVIYEVSNLGDAKFRIRGDGRLWFGQAATNPASPVDGDFWYDGAVFKYRSGGVTFTLGSSYGLSSYTATTTATLVVGQPVVASVTGVSPANASTAYDAIGLSAAGYSAASTATILTDGAVVSSPDWTSLTGSPDLTIGLNYLVTNAGGLATTAGDTIVVVGQAVSARAIRVAVRVIL